MKLKKQNSKIMILIGMLLVLIGSVSAADVLFMHHSTGADLVNRGNVREEITSAGHNFYDHDYNWIGLRDASGSETGISFNVPGDNTDPDGWATVFTQPLHSTPDNTFSHMMQYDVIAFKSCFPTSNIESNLQLEEYKAYYRSIRDRADDYPNKLFIVMTPPPNVPAETTTANAARAREWSNWLKSSEFLGGRTNIVTFDFFDQLAGSDNRLRSEYRQDAYDSHPNAHADSIVGPIFAEFVNNAIATSGVEFDDTTVHSTTVDSESDSTDTSKDSTSDTESDETSSDNSSSDDRSSHATSGVVIDGSSSTIENFETEINLGIDTDGMSTINCRKTVGAAYSGSGAITVTYDVSPSGYPSCGSYFDPILNKAESEGIEFWINPTSEGDYVKFTVSTGRSDGPTPFQVAFTTPTAGRWTKMQFRWEEFQIPEWMGGSGTIDPSRIVGFGFDFGTGHDVSGTFMVDDIATISETTSSESETSESEDNESHETPEDESSDTEDTTSDTETQTTSDTTDEIADIIDETSETSDSATETTDETTDIAPFEIMINDFEEKQYWERYTEGKSKIKCARNGKYEFDGRRSLKIYYKVWNGQYASCGNTFEPMVSEIGGEGVSFRIRSQKSDHTVKLLVFSGDLMGAQPFEYEFTTTNEMKNGFVKVDVPFSEFELASWADTSAGTTIDSERIIGLGFDIPPQGRKKVNTMWVDAVELYGTQGGSGSINESTGGSSDSDTSDDNGSNVDDSVDDNESNVDDSVDDNGSSSDDTSDNTGTTNDNGSTDSSDDTQTYTGTVTTIPRINPSDLTYAGAFRLPGDTASTGNGFEWGGTAASYHTGHDGLYIASHNWDQQIAEVSVPTPVNSRNLESLPTASIIQDFTDVKGSRYGYLEIGRVGIEYLPAQSGQTEDKLYYAWGQHMQESDYGVSHGWTNADLSSIENAGLWNIEGQHKYTTTDYMFEIPTSFADTYLGGKKLATGRYRDGGQGWQGPNIVAIAPWQDGNPPVNGATLSATPVLQYSSVYEDFEGEHAIDGYHHSDSWSGGAWLESGSSQAVIFVGYKGQGANWYGWEDGTAWYRYHIDSDWNPTVHGDGERGWWSDSWQAQILFYDATDLARVAAGEIEAWNVQPFATMNINDEMFNPAIHNIREIGSVAYDRENNRLFVIEYLGDTETERPIVHVWNVG